MEKKLTLEQALAELKALKQRQDEIISSAVISAVSSTVDYVNKLKAENDRLRASGWIAGEPPANSGPFLAWNPEWGNVRLCCRGVVLFDGINCDSYCYAEHFNGSMSLPAGDKSRPTHWMPLPAPPSE